MKINLLIIFSIFCASLPGQIPIKGSYYAFDTISQDGDTNFYLRYIEINNGDLKYLVFPIIMINADWVESDDDRFNFGDRDNVVTGQGKVFQADQNYICSLLFSKGQHFNDNIANRYLKESFLLIRHLSDSTISINSKIFKEDSRLRIFQRFTGY